MSFLAKFSPLLLSVLRIVTGLILLQHGTSKFLGIPESQMTGVDVTSMFGIAGIFELVGGALLVIGLFTRPAAFILSGMAAAAYFIVHAPQGFYPLLNGGELAMLFCFTLLYLAAAGAGPLSVDRAIGNS